MHNKDTKNNLTIDQGLGFELAKKYSPNKNFEFVEYANNVKSKISPYHEINHFSTSLKNVVSELMSSNKDNVLITQQVETMLKNLFEALKVEDGVEKEKDKSYFGIINKQLVDSVNNEIDNITKNKTNLDQEKLDKLEALNKKFDALVEGMSKEIKFTINKQGWISNTTIEVNIVNTDQNALRAFKDGLNNIINNYKYTLGQDTNDLEKKNSIALNGVAASVKKTLNEKYKEENKYQAFIINITNTLNNIIAKQNNSDISDEELNGDIKLYLDTFKNDKVLSLEDKFQINQIVSNALASSKSNVSGTLINKICNPISLFIREREELIAWKKIQTTLDQGIAELVNHIISDVKIEQISNNNISEINRQKDIRKNFIKASQESINSAVRQNDFILYQSLFQNYANKEPRLYGVLQTKLLHLILEQVKIAQSSAPDKTSLKDNLDTAVIGIKNINDNIIKSTYEKIIKDEIEIASYKQFGETKALSEEGLNLIYSVCNGAINDSHYSTYIKEKIAEMQALKTLSGEDIAMKVDGFTKTMQYLANFLGNFNKQEGGKKFGPNNLSAAAIYLGKRAQEALLEIEVNTAIKLIEEKLTDKAQVEEIAKAAIDAKKSIENTSKGRIENAQALLKQIKSTLSSGSVNPNAKIIDALESLSVSISSEKPHSVSKEFLSQAHDEMDDAKKAELSDVLKNIEHAYRVITIQESHTNEILVQIDTTNMQEQNKQLCIKVNNKLKTLSAIVGTEEFYRIQAATSKINSKLSALNGNVEKINEVVKDIESLDSQIPNQQKIQAILEIQHNRLNKIKGNLNNAKFDFQAESQADNSKIEGYGLSLYDVALTDPDAIQKGLLEELNRVHGPNLKQDFKLIHDHIKAKAILATIILKIQDKELNIELNHQLSLICEDLVSIFEDDKDPENLKKNIMKVLEAAYVKDANLENSSMLQNIIFDVAKEFGKNKTELLNQLQNSISDKLLEQRCAKESEAFLLEYKFNKLENYEARKESFKTFYLDAVKLYGNDNQFENTNTTINELNLLNDKYPEFALFSNEVIQAIRNTKAVGTKDKERYLSQDVVKNEIKQPNNIDGLKSYFTDAVVNELPKEKVLGFAYKIVYDWGGMTPECKQDITSKLSKRHTENMDQHNHQHNTYISLFTEPKKTNRLIEILKQKDATKNNNTMLENFNVDEFASDIPFDVLISMLEIGKRLESNEGKKQHGIIESWQDFKKDSSLANFGKVIINVITAIMNAIPILINMFQDKEINKGLESLAQHVKSISMHDNTEKKDLLQGKITSFLKAVPQHEERKR